MSAALVREFFPWLWNSVQEHPKLLGGLWNLLFPASVEKLCPRPETVIQILGEYKLRVMWPLGSLFCCLGIALGFLQGIPLLREALCGSGRPRKGSFTWGCAFVWYGLMSTGGLVFHCMAKEKAFYLLDVVATACCCFSIMSACILTCSTTLDDRDRWSGYRACLCACYVALVSAGLWGSQCVRDVGLYLGPSFAAVAVGAWFCAKQIYTLNKMSSMKASSWLWLAGAIVSALASLGSLPMDSWLCRHLGANFSMLPWFFLGSDLAIFCLYRFSIIGLNQQHHKSS